eukprot:2902890-Alexandrium_andersonii.AAC.1
MPECDHVGRNTDWAHTVEQGGGHFACPICGIRYQPWKPGSAGRLGANKVLTVHVGTSDTPLELEGGGVIEPGKALIYPLWWADAATNNLQN